MSKKAQQRAARLARIQRHVQQPALVPSTPPAPPRVFPRVTEPFYLPELLGFTPSCWQGDCPRRQDVPIIRRIPADANHDATETNSE